MSHHFFCEFADQTLKRLILGIVGLISLIMIGACLYAH